MEIFDEGRAAVSTHRQEILAERDIVNQLQEHLAEAQIDDWNFWYDQEYGSECEMVQEDQEDEDEAAEVNQVQPAMQAPQQPQSTSITPPVLQGHVPAELLPPTQMPSFAMTPLPPVQPATTTAPPPPPPPGPSPSEESPQQVSQPVMQQPAQPEPSVPFQQSLPSTHQLDHMVKKAVREEAEQRKLTSQAQVTSAAVTTSSGASSTTVKDVVTSIPEDPAAEAAEEEGSKAESESAEKAITAAWEADFSLEDAPTPPSKDVLTTGMGRKNLMVAAVTPEDEDSEMPEADAAAASHLGSGAKRKGRSTSQGAAKKRALPLKSPRAASAGPKAKSAPADKSSSGNKMPRAVSHQGKAVGKPAAKPPPKAITLLGKAAVAKPPQKAVTAKAPPSTADKAWGDWEAAKAKVAERQQQENLAAPKSPPAFRSRLEPLHLP